MNVEHLTETSPELEREVRSAMRDVFGRDDLEVGSWNSGGGCMILSVDLSLDGRAMGRQLWLTRDGDSWLLGIYPNGNGDGYGIAEGVVVALLADPDSPDQIAGAVGRLLISLGVDRLEGE